MLNTNLALVFVLITCNYIDHVLSVLDLYIISGFVHIHVLSCYGVFGGSK